MEVPLADLEERHLDQATEIWESGWFDAHDGLVPDDLKALRTTESFRSRLQDHMSDTRIGLDGDDVLGLCITRADELYQMYVSPRARGKGLARALIEDAEAKMRRAGVKTAWLACAVGNLRAARFYEKSGWTNIGVRTEHMDTSEGPFALDVWRFEKALPGV